MKPGWSTSCETYTCYWLEFSFAANVPRLGRTGDPAQDLQEVLHTDALSAGYRVRNVYGNSYTDTLWTLLCGLKGEANFFRWFTDNHWGMGLRGFTDLLSRQTATAVLCDLYDSSTETLRPDKLPLVHDAGRAGLHWRIACHDQPQHVATQPTRRAGRCCTCCCGMPCGWNTLAPPRVFSARRERRRWRHPNRNW